jgi:endonuclease G
MTQFSHINILAHRSKLGIAPALIFDTLGKSEMHLTKNLRSHFFALMVGLAAVGNFGCTSLVTPSGAEPEKNSATSETTALLPFGNPSNADRSNRNNFLVLKHSFALSYNNDRGELNWTAWRTTIDDLGESVPRPSFAPDQNLPFALIRITPSDYNGSGFDRGHMVPAADRFGSPDFGDTFLMTNVVPQTPELNQYPWEKLESYARGAVRRGSDVYTIAGVYGDKGRLSGRVTVPTNCWKIVIILPRGANEVNENTRVIAVDMPNENGIKQRFWQDFRVSVRAIEAKTGYDFFSVLPRNLQDVIETHVDTDPSRRVKP